MSQGVQVAGVYVRDQDEAVDFYVGKVGFECIRTREMATIAG